MERKGHEGLYRFDLSEDKILHLVCVGYIMIHWVETHLPLLLYAKR
jgi:hypothetical protein